MISTMEGCEYITMVADLIEVLNGLDKFKLKIWVANNELSFDYDSDNDFLFLNEGMRITTEKEYKYIGKRKRHSYIFYDNILNVQVIMDEEGDV